jgi:hypothetical protein
LHGEDQVGGDLLRFLGAVIFSWVTAMSGAAGLALIVLGLWIAARAVG